MGGVDLSDRMKVTFKVDSWNKFRFYLRIFFDFLDIAVVNSKIVCNKTESAPALSSLDFRYSIAQTMIRKFSSRKRAVPLSRPSKRSRGPSFDIVDHLPDFAPSRVRCAFCSSKNVESRTYVRCITCNIALCLQKDRNCFQQYHTKQWFIVTFLKYSFIYLWRHHIQHDYSWIFALQFISCIFI